LRAGAGSRSVLEQDDVVCDACGDQHSVLVVAERVLPTCSCTILTARSRTSGENLFDFFIASSSQELKPPQNPGRFNYRPKLLFGWRLATRMGVLRSVDGNFWGSGLHPLTRRATARSPTHSNSRRASLRGAAAPHPAIHMTGHPFRNVFKI
jgi:hypothetical protein